MYKVLVWGTGSFSREITELFNSNVKIIAFLDNDTNKQGNMYSEKFKIISPQIIGEINYDYIIVASSFESEIMKQLIQLGVKSNRIIKGLSNVQNIIKNESIFDIKKLIGRMLTQVYQNSREMKENNYRNKFNDTIAGIEWWKTNTSLSLGDWAVGYNYVYFLVRILNSMKPKSILELGLGQSSKVISNYYNYYNKLENIRYEIIEQDNEWVEFYKSENYIDDKIKINILPLIKVYNKEYNTEVNVYDNFKKNLINKKYDVISIDGPFGSEQISRIDILECIPECLNKSFIIIIDDYNREGEKNMVFELENILKSKKIGYVKAISESVKDICIIASEDKKFLCTI